MRRVSLSISIYILNVQRIEKVGTKVFFGMFVPTRFDNFDCFFRFWLVQTFQKKYFCPDFSAISFRPHIESIVYETKAFFGMFVPPIFMDIGYKKPKHGRGKKSKSMNAIG